MRCNLCMGNGMFFSIGLKDVVCPRCNGDGEEPLGGK